MITCLAVKYSMCVQACKEAIDFYMNKDLPGFSSIIQMDIMEEDDGTIYYIYRIYGPVSEYIYWHKELEETTTVYLGWN